MKATQVIAYLQKQIESLGIDPEIDIVTEHGEPRTQYEEVLKSMAVSKTYIGGSDKPEKDKSRIKLIGASFE